MRRTLRLLPVLALVAGAAALVPRTAALAEVTCTDTSMTNDGIGLTSSLGLPSGRLEKGAPAAA